MTVVLNKIPKNPIILEGFPGFGLVGTITTEYLVNQLKAEPIGYIELPDIRPMVAIHEGKLIRPIGLYYDKKTNLLIVHVMTNVEGLEWQLADALLEVARKTSAKMLVSVEGVGAPDADTESHKPYYYTNDATIKKKFDKENIEELKEGIILGVTATLLLRNLKQKIVCIFTETHSQLPDSKSAAVTLDVLDKVLGIKVDNKLLLEQAAAFEEKIKSVVAQAQQAQETQRKKTLSYFG
jgi:uncharacterized protein